MKSYSLTHLADSTLLEHLAALVARDRATTADLLAHIGEVDARKLYLHAAYSSMFAYCVGHLRMSEDMAYKRVRAARASRRFPSILTAVAEGRLHLTAVVLLVPYLTEETAADLLAAAEHKTKAEVEMLVAARYPRPDLPTVIEALGSSVSPLPQSFPPCANRLVPEPVNVAIGQPGREPNEPPVPAPCANRLVPEPVNVAIGQPGQEPIPAPAPAEMPAPQPRMTPLAPERFGLQVTISQATRDKLRHAQDLLGHRVQSGDVALVLDLALDALIRKLEARKHAATERPRPPRWRKPSDGRHIPADVRRAVWARDGGQCTFRSETGHRCTARRGLQFDHVQEYARGGEATVSGIRLRCQAHNQFEADRTFGAEFMRNKREAAGRGLDPTGSG